jgi:hypothetical protein
MLLSKLSLQSHCRHSTRAALSCPSNPLVRWSHCHPLLQLRDINDRMQDVANEAPSASVQHALSRHRALLASHERDSRRVASRIRDAKNRADLLPSVQRDIKCALPSCAYMPFSLARGRSHALGGCSVCVCVCVSVCVCVCVCARACVFVCARTAP